MLVLKQCLHLQVSQSQPAEFSRTWDRRLEQEDVSEQQQLSSLELVDFMWAINNKCTEHARHSGPSNKTNTCQDGSTGTETVHHTLCVGLGSPCGSTSSLAKVAEGKAEHGYMCTSKSSTCHCGRRRARWVQRIHCGQTEWVQAKDEEPEFHAAACVGR